MNCFGKRISSLFMVLCVMIGLMPAAAAASADITENVDAGDKNYIGRTVFKDYFDEESGEDFEYLEFDSFDDFDDYGYFTAIDVNNDEVALDDSELDDGTFYYSSSNVSLADDYKLATLAFVADEDAKDATLEFNFTLYGDGNDEVEGVLEITVDGSSSSSSASASVKLTMELEAGGQLSFDENDFYEAFQDEYSSDTLSYIKFTGSTDLERWGALYGYDYVDEDNFEISVESLTDSRYYYDSDNEEDYLIEDLTYYADGDADSKEIILKFTMYGEKKNTLSGTLTINIIGKKEYKLMGDINGDGYSDSGDALLALRCAVDDYSPTAEQKLVGDVNHDGFVNAGDAVMILRYDAGLLDSLGSLPDIGDPDTPSGKPTFVYTESTSEKAVYADLGSIVVEDYTWSAYVNGALQKPKTTVSIGNATVILSPAFYPSADSEQEWAYTGEGTVTEVYVDHELRTVTVRETNYYLGQVTKVKTDDLGKYITVKELSEGSDLDILIFHTDGFEEDDYIVYTQTVNEEDHNVISAVFHPETVSGIVTSIKTNPNAGLSYLGIDREQYCYTEDASNFTDSSEPVHQDHMAYNLDSCNIMTHPTLKDECVLYLDPNGFVLGYEVTKPAYHYLYVKDSDEEMGEWTAKVLLDDGTTEIVKLDESKYDIQWISTDTKAISNIDGKIFKYLINDNGECELVPIVEEEEADGIDNTTDKDVDEQDSMGIKEGSAPAAIKNGKAYITNGVNKIIVDRRTIFIDDENNTSYIGYKEVPNIDDVKIAYVINSRIVEIAFIPDGDIYNTDATYFILSNDDRESLKYDSKLYWEYEDAYVNGEKTSVIVAYDCIKDNTDENGELITRDILDVAKLYKVKKTVDEDYITEIEVVTPERTGMPSAVGEEAFWLIDEQDNEVKYDTDENTVYVYVEYDEETDEYTISEGNLKDLKDDNVTSVWGIESDDEYARLVYIFATIPASIPEATYFMLSSQDREALKYDSKYFWEYKDAYINGEKTYVIVSYDYDGIAGNDPVLSVATPYQIKQTVDGDYITEIGVINETSDGVTTGFVSAVGEDTFWIENTDNMSWKFDADENTVYVYAEYDEADAEWTISEGNLKDMADNDVYSVVVIESTEEMAELVYIFATVPAAEEVI